MSDTPLTDKLIGNKMQYRTMDEGILIRHAQELEIKLNEITNKYESLKRAYNRLHKNTLSMVSSLPIAGTGD